LVIGNIKQISLSISQLCYFIYYTIIRDSIFATVTHTWTKFWI
jgi:hypothetical protein